MTIEQLVTRLKRNTNDGLKLHARIEAGAVVFAGGRHGNASIWLDVSSTARVIAHWEGYCEANGAKAKPDIGARVRFQRGMFGMWPARVVSSCATSAVLAFTRRNGSKGRARVPVEDIRF